MTTQQSERQSMGDCSQEWERGSIPRGGKVGVRIKRVCQWGVSRLGLTLFGRERNRIGWAMHDLSGVKR
jgi:hypothetical protein